MAVALDGSDSPATAPGPTATTDGAPAPRLTVALSKGRILDEALPLLARAGLAPAGDIGRLLRVPSQTPGVDLLLIRPTDVPTYVEYGAADLGLVGKDILIEHGGAALYEPLDLNIARCRMAVAAPAASAFAAPGGWPPPVGSSRRLTVATKYPVIARDYFAGLGVQVELIKLYGSMELAPLVGLADVIVDLVATGGTLRANGLAEIALIRPVTTRVVVNRAAMKRAHARLKPLIARLAAPD